MHKAIRAVLFPAALIMVLVVTAIAQSCPAGTTPTATAYGSYCAPAASSFPVNGTAAATQPKPELLDEHTDDPLYNRIAAAYNELMKLPASPPVESLETPYDREAYNVLTIKSRALAAYAAAEQEMFNRENDNFKKFREAAITAGDDLYRQGYRQALADVAKKIQESGYRYQPPANAHPEVVCHSEYEYPDRLKTVCR